ncbi:MAG: orotate phosphoribosyltransferase [Desulfomonilia bacterium]|nr:orotate phosphoribosyltransferase [Desulfomonilia bacterium]
MSSIDELRTLVIQDAVKIGTFTLASGRVSDLYVNMRKVTLNPKGAFLIGSIITEMISGREVDAVGGMSLGADPIAVATSIVAFQSGRHVVSFLVRKAQKDHGTRNLIEGPIAPGMKAVIVEDVITTGASTIAAIERVRDAGMSIDMVVAIFDRCEGGREAIESLGIEVRSILSRKDILSSTP